MALFEVTDDGIREIDTTTFADARLLERGDLQRLLRRQVEIIVPNGYVLAEEFGDWDESIRRIDLLVVDQDANLVVVELKRTVDGGHMELQAIRYAAMVSQMTWDQAVEAHRQYLLKLGVQEDAQTRLLTFLGWNSPNDGPFAQDVRIVLASAGFSKELTTTVLWLNERTLDIRCVRLVPHKYREKVLLDVQTVIPLPEVEEYQIKVKEKATQERLARIENADRKQRFREFWFRLLKKANDVSTLHRSVSATDKPWIGTSMRGLRLNYVTVRDKGRVELYLDRREIEENKQIFDDLCAHRAEIEGAFGAPLNWQRLDERGACRVSYEVDAGSFRDESTWDALHDAMVATMQRFAAALAPHLDPYRNGEKSVGAESM